MRIIIGILIIVGVLTFARLIQSNAERKQRGNGMVEKPRDWLPSGPYNIVAWIIIFVLIKIMNAVLS